MSPLKKDLMLSNNEIKTKKTTRENKKMKLNLCPNKLNKIE